jgi:hypothetical protein
VRESVAMRTLCAYNCWFRWQMGHLKSKKESLVCVPIIERRKAGSGKGTGRIVRPSCDDGPVERPCAVSPYSDMVL